MDRNPYTLGSSGSGTGSGGPEDSAGLGGFATSGNPSSSGQSTAGSNSESGGPSAAGGSASDSAGGSPDGTDEPVSGGGTNPSSNGGTSGTGEVPTPTGECEDGEVADCGECGKASCDATLKWGPCIGDGRQRACWETQAGEPLPGVMPAEPKGSCHAGQQTCETDGGWSACVGAVAPAAKDDCETPGDDSNCDAVTNGGCTCVADTTRRCGTDTGNCAQGTQTCTNNAWGGCMGEITAQAADSCNVAGDDANCNGTPNDNCTCHPGNVMTACNDNLACTNDTCNNGVCGHSVTAGNCLINGQCVASGAKDPSNPCRVCNPSSNAMGWSAAPNNTSCDDGKFCNGNDNCDATGNCQHQFPTNNRCSGTQPCDATTCGAAEEQRGNCFKPSGTICGETEEFGCASTACGGDVQKRTVPRTCTGSSSQCTGTGQPGSWETATLCGTTQKCDGTNRRCNEVLECANAWCDTSLCWTATDTSINMTQPEAISYCQGLTLGGRTWRLPRIHDYLALARGCNGDVSSGAGVPQGESFKSTCAMAPQDMGTVRCTACPDGQGPGGGGCYWPAGMGFCNGAQGYHSSTLYQGLPLVFRAETNTVNWDPGLTFAPRAIRCITDR